jgi:hypothetical protein
MTVALMQLTPLTPVQRWNDVPASFAVPGSNRVVQGAQVGWTDGTYMLCDVVLVNNPPHQWAVSTGYTYTRNGSTVTATTTYPPDGPTQANLLAYATSKRSIRMASGTTVSGVLVTTDAMSLNLFGLAYLKAKADSTFAMNWYDKSTDSWVLWRTTPIVANGEALGVFLADCYAREKTAYDGIKAGTITTTGQIDAIFA